MIKRSEHLLPARLYPSLSVFVCTLLDPFWTLIMRLCLSSFFFSRSDSLDDQRNKAEDTWHWIQIMEWPLLWWHKALWCRTEQKRKQVIYVLYISGHSYTRMYNNVHVVAVKCVTFGCLLLVEKVEQLAVAHSDSFSSLQDPKSWTLLCEYSKCKVCLCVSGDTHMSKVSVCSQNKLLQWGAVTNKLSLSAISWLNKESFFPFFFLLFYNTPSLFQVLRRQMPGARGNWILHLPRSQWAVPRAKLAGVKFQISLRAAQTPAALLETDWQAKNHFESPRAGCNRHWAGLNLKSKSQYIVI